MAARRPREGLDRIVRLAGQFFGVSICAISGKTLERAWTKSDQQFFLTDIQNAALAWAKAVGGTDPLVVLDATRDERFSSLPLASAPPGIRFYAGVPLAGGCVPMRVLAILDTRPRARLDAGQLSALRDFAALAREEMEPDGAMSDWLSMAQQEAEDRRQQAERELRASREQLRQLAARLESAREQERIRIARQIHDELGQMLSALKMDLGEIENRFRSSSSRSLKEITTKLGAVLESLDSIMCSLRRISSELRPCVLDHLGIAAAIEWQLREFRTRTGITCNASGLPEHIPLDDEQATVVFRIFQEILSNIVRHANATQVTVEVRLRAGRLTLRVVDNGRGFVREQMSDPDALGLLGMRERALLLGGIIEFDSHPGKGTSVTLQIPAATRELASAMARG